MYYEKAIVSLQVTGTFTGNDSTSNYLYEGHSVTGANTSHNGTTNVALQRDNGI